MAIVKDQVFRVADELDAAGQKPTLAAVRKALGGGSFSTISEAMNEWRALKASRQVTNREPVPAAVMERLGDLAGDLWAVAMDLANNRLAAEREAFEQARQEAEAAQREAAELAEQLTSELDEARGRIEALEREKAQIEQTVNELRQTLAQAHDQARIELATAREEAAELRGELKAHQEQVAALLGRIQPAK